MVLDCKAPMSGSNWSKEPRGTRVTCSDLPYVGASTRETMRLHLATGAVVKGKGRISLLGVMRYLLGLIYMLYLI